MPQFQQEMNSEGYILAPSLQWVDIPKIETLDQRQSSNKSDHIFHFYGWHRHKQGPSASFRSHPCRTAQRDGYLEVVVHPPAICAALEEARLDRYTVYFLDMVQWICFRCLNPHWFWVWVPLLLKISCNYSEEWPCNIWYILITIRKFMLRRAALYCSTE